ncbi:MAG: hypothetical protein SXA11_21960 [Cyanobacteriota bacterium]|nr:hypothetical protein [Cyanobacteriota bacterium]
MTLTTNCHRHCPHRCCRCYYWYREFVERARFVERAGTACSTEERSPLSTQKPGF